MMVNLLDANKPLPAFKYAIPIDGYVITRTYAISLEAKNSPRSVQSTEGCPVKEVLGSMVIGSMGYFTYLPIPSMGLVYLPT